METLLEKTRKINELLQQKNAFEVENDLPYDNMAVALSSIINANSYIIDESGKLLGYHESLAINNERMQRMIEERELTKEYTQKVRLISKTQANIPVTDDLSIFPGELKEKFPNAWTIIIPIYGAGRKLGAIILGREDDKFQADDLVLGEYSSTVVGMQLLYHQSKTIEEKVRNQAAIQMAIPTLSYSELKAVKAILGALDGHEGRLTASQIADEIGITRSVIVNALRKLESAGVIESRSLGMKGTYLRILKPGIIDEIMAQNI
ncbi:MAG: GTP-sensing pleiotropic transcriptional regulator CodY [Streptococcaceae bacterium]|jgi:transcriptional pleiotropic repressor|nr:GTP-sensing pleiotropic transcriptional regulator CodY [Streptococcaceae bacterium]